MPALAIAPTGVEKTFPENEIIVSKTNLKGIITYANLTFCKISGYSEEDVLGQPHNMIRHPDMPRCVFNLLWDTIQSGNEIFAYVVNLCKNGDHYWVFAHVTPTFNEAGGIIGYHSSRRVPEKSAISKVIPLYKLLKDKEDSCPDKKLAIEASTNLLMGQLNELGLQYDEFVFTL